MKRIEDRIWHPNVPTSRNVRSGAWKSYERSQKKWHKFKMVCKHEIPREKQRQNRKHIVCSSRKCFHFSAGLGEFRIRDLNDEINKLLREKRHWENQISALGGPHYRRYGPKMFDAEGREVPGNRGYKYFGAAKDLPGVRELFEQEPPPPPRKTRAELMKDVDADYYGYRDDDDGVLIPLEEKAEKIAILKALIEWKEKQKSGDKEEDDEEELYPPDKDVSLISCF